MNGIEKKKDDLLILFWSPNLFPFFFFFFFFLLFSLSILRKLFFFLIFHLFRLYCFGFYSFNFSRFTFYSLSTFNFLKFFTVNHIHQRISFMTFSLFFFIHSLLIPTGYIFAPSFRQILRLTFLINNNLFIFFIHSIIFLWFCYTYLFKLLLNKHRKPIHSYLLHNIKPVTLSSNQRPCINSVCVCVRARACEKELKSFVC